MQNVNFQGALALLIALISKLDHLEGRMQKYIEIENNTSLLMSRQYVIQISNL